MPDRACPRHLAVTGALLGALALSACAPKPAPKPAPVAPAKVSCSSTQAQASASSEPALTTAEAEAEAKSEYETAPARGAFGSVPLTTVERVGTDVEISTVPVGSAEQAADVAEAAAQGNDLLSVEAAQPVQALEGLVAPTVASNDPYRSQQWALGKVPFETAWSTTNGSGAVVAVVDTGVQSSHPDLSGQVLGGYRYWHEGSVAREAAMTAAFDDHGHGTHVAGIVAAVANNAIGVTGAAPGVKILPVKVLNDQGSGWSDDVARGIDWAASHGADVINLSLGGPASKVITDAVNSAVARGVIVFAAAGNGGAGAPASYPGADANAIAVASVTPTLTRSSFSTTGTYVDVAAPGSGIQSTVPISVYGSMSGTSMATPYAAAEGALLAARHPTWSVAQLRDRLLTTANDLGAAGMDTEYGCGLIDPVEAVA